jgi:hypothetical protein
MPRICKICQEEFSSAAKLSEHLKFSNCSNYRTLVKCPYCLRDDFVDDDSLNRHLSHNRQCSRADMDATDKLSMLLPNPSYTSIKGTQSQTNHNHNSLVMFPSGVMENMTQYEGNLVNFVNSFNVNHLHQIQTSLNGHTTKVFQDGKEITVVVYENDPSTTINKEIPGNEKQLHCTQEVQKDVIATEENPVELPPEEFDIGADEGYDDDDVNSRGNDSAGAEADQNEHEVNDGD